MSATGQIQSDEKEKAKGLNVMQQNTILNSISH